ncbi:hypothetical protein Cadr_000011184 [Camelus dromedarius]|uniref:Uncharacterized protein n=1 Tax=Camelus dromedarius TaxID=9838 RepID=A0A5N4DR73_CAMDR|nr:hypothetical protein Cadr_000011184 [Camelus dromedarius]
MWPVLPRPVVQSNRTMLWGKTGIYTVLPSIKRQTALKAKGHRGLPENPAELREAFNFPNDLSNWIQVGQQGEKLDHMDRKRISMAAKSQLLQLHRCVWHRGQLWEYKVVIGIHGSGRGLCRSLWLGSRT